MKTSNEISRLLDKRKCIKGSSHYLGDKQDFDVLSKGPTYTLRRAFARNVGILFIA